MKCPKCGAEIKRFDLAPNCKSCGVHIMYYTQEEDLSRDAKKTELEFASARYLLERIKTAYIKGRIPVLRLIIGPLTIATLLLPQYNINLSFPWWNYEISVGALGVYNIISDSFWKVLPELGSLGIADALCGITVASYILLLVTALILLVCAVFYFAAFVDIRRTAKISCVLSGVAILTSLANTVLSIIAVNISGGVQFLTVKPMFGGLLSILFLGIYLATNIIMAVSPSELQLRAADRERLDIRERLKRGEITLDELSLPIVAEEETDKKDDKKKNKRKRGKKK